MSNNVTTSSRIGFVGLLTILFIGLKLGGVIEWNWFWVLSPIIFSAIFAGTILLIVFLGFLLVLMFKK